MGSIPVRAFFLSLLLVIALPATALAGDFRAGEDNPKVSGAVDDDVYVVGDAILVSGDVTGDVLAAGRSVKLTGSAGTIFFCRRPERRHQRPRRTDGSGRRPGA